MSNERIYKKRTIRDVANLAGVSITTVSHVVSGRRAYSAETEQKVQKAIRDLEYVPSYVVRGLRHESTLTLGACITDPFRESLKLRRTFAEQLWRGVIAEADIQGYSTLHYPEAIRSGKDHRPFLSGLIDGMLATCDPEDERPARLAAAGLPVVVLGLDSNIPDGVGAVVEDETTIVTLALSHLFDLGHRVIAHIPGPLSNAPERDNISQRRTEAFRTLMTSRGLLREDLIAESESWEPVSISETLRSWSKLENRPTAIFCSNDAIALQALADAKTVGLRVPEDLSIIGVDDIPEASLSSPTLTTIRVPIEELGREGVRCLVRMLRGEPASQCRVTLRSSELVHRFSTSPVRGHSSS
jgi:LacI family transcriptional regulator